MKQKTQKIIALALALYITVIGAIPQSKAVGGDEPETHFSVDCNSSTKRGKFGFTINPDNPTQSDLAVLFIYRFKVIPTGTTTVADINNKLTITSNTQYPIRILVSEKEQRTDHVLVDITAGFTDELGVRTAEDLLFFTIENPETKTYTVEINQAQIYLLNDASQTNAYIPETAAEQFEYDTSDCDGTTTTTTTTTTTAANTSTTQASGAQGTTTTTTTTTTATPGTPVAYQATITSTKGIVNATNNPIVFNQLSENETVLITATVTGGTDVRASWSQEDGTPILNPVTNANQQGANLVSTLQFTIPRVTLVETIKLKLEVNDIPTNRTITKNFELPINGAVRPAAPIATGAAELIRPPILPSIQNAGTNQTGSQTATATTTAATATTVVASQDNTTENKTAANTDGGEKNETTEIAQTTAKNAAASIVNNATARNLPEAGPKETMYFILVTSLLAAAATRKLKIYT